MVYDRDGSLHSRFSNATVVDDSGNKCRTLQAVLLESFRVADETPGTGVSQHSKFVRNSRSALDVLGKEAGSSQESVAGLSPMAQLLLLQVAFSRNRRNPSCADNCVDLPALTLP